MARFQNWCSDLALVRQFVTQLGSLLRYALVRIFVDETVETLLGRVYKTSTSDAGLARASITNVLQAVDIAAQAAIQIKRRGNHCASTVYRIQGGPSRTIFDVDDNGNFTFPKNVEDAFRAAGLERVYVTFDNPSEVKRWLQNNRTSPDVVVVSASIDRSFVEVVRAAAYFQNDSHKRFTEVFGEPLGSELRHNLPDIADPTTSVTAGNEQTGFGIPLSWMPYMIASICPGTGKIETRSDFLARH